MKTEEDGKNKEDREDEKRKEFSDQKKFSYEYFKQIATFSISLIAIYEGISRLVQLEREFSDYFLIGISILFLTVVFCFFAMMFLIYDFFPELIQLHLLNTLWVCATTGFILGLFCLITDFHLGIESIYTTALQLILIGASSLITIGFLIVILSHFGKLLCSKLKKK